MGCCCCCCHLLRAEHKATLPPLSAQQELKLKQLTVASLGAQHKVLAPPLPLPPPQPPQPPLPTILCSPFTNLLNNTIKRCCCCCMSYCHQVLPYQLLSAQLGITGLRQLEDFLITDCFYAGKDT